MIPTNLDEIDEAALLLDAALQIAATLDLGNFLRAERAEELEHEIAIPLRAAISEAIKQLGRIEALIDGPTPDGDDWDDMFEPPAIPAAPPFGGQLNDELWQQVTDMCFAARGELRRADRALRPCEANHEDRLAACEAAHRKLRRALAAVLAAIGRARERTFPVLVMLGADVDAAIAVRRMYTKFRRSLPPCDPADHASVRRALRYVAVSLAVMVGSSDFGDARTQDRALILKLQSRILRWARDGSSDADGVLLHKDIVTTADLLRSINLRQELAAHDREMLAQAAAALAAGDPAVAIAGALPALRALEGREDALDALTSDALRHPPTPDLVAALRAVVSPAIPANPLSAPGGGDDVAPE